MLLSRMRLRLKEAYYPYYDGYGLEYTGMVKTRSWNPNLGTPQTFGQSLTLTLNGIDMFRVKPRYSAFGVVGGVASVVATILGLLAGLCDPAIDYDDDSGKDSGKEEIGGEEKPQPPTSAGDIEIAEMNTMNARTT